MVLRSFSLVFFCVFCVFCSFVPVLFSICSFGGVLLVFYSFKLKGTFCLGEGTFITYNTKLGRDRGVSS